MRINTVFIKEICNRNGLSQNQLADQIGITKGALSNALSGKRGVGRKTLVGLLKMLPEETVSSLTR
ncbi:MAG: helix-turn-helix transcriptional regulator [Candidatus Syntrophosphaera sp.]|nr:helix-turn-helix transcriptional regulator [Candidatus Syntrophosphaera sp.]